MRISTVASFLWVGLAAAQRPNGTSICDYYTGALLKENNATNQLTVLTLVVNTALIGNYTAGNKNAVTGILNKGTYNGTDVNLLPYFDGSLKSTNRGNATSLSFLDDGGAAPLMKNMPSNGNKTSNQYMLISHLYEFFGTLLGCSDIGMPGYAAYDGQTDMFAVHKYMDLNPTQLGYFITQVGLSAASFGVATDDVTAVGKALSSAFGYRCSPEVAIIPGTTPASQAICQDASCPIAPNATCAASSTPTAPVYTNGTSFTPAGGSNSSSTGTSSGATPSKTGGASTLSVMSVSSVLGFGMVIAGLLL